MAGFFGLFDYTKEGPGVPENAPPKPRIKVFFEVLGRKFWNIVKINVMFGLFNLPAIIIAFLLAVFITPMIIPQETMSDFLNADGVMFGIFPLLLCIICIPVITVGPAQAGMTYLMRNYSREEHAFIWSDFKEHALKNLKQSLIVSVINLLLSVLAVMDLYLYSNIAKDNPLLSAASVFVVFALIILIMMNMYIYPMMVTFKLTIKQLYKNALLFSLIKFFPNLLILIVCLALILVPFYFQPIIAFVLFIFITMGLISLITNFYVYPKLEKYMMKDGEPEESNQ